MRLWSIHPKYLDKAGLVALWRESLLAKKVLEGKTKGYKNHPQLERFKKTKTPVFHINSYLLSVLKEACKRGYCFDKSKIEKTKKPLKTYKIKINSEQINYEFRHLMKKLKKRDSKCYNKNLAVKKPIPNPLFKVVKGPVESWEKFKNN